MDTGTRSSSTFYPSLPVRSLLCNLETFSFDRGVQKLHLGGRGSVLDRTVPAPAPNPFHAASGCERGPGPVGVGMHASAAAPTFPVDSTNATRLINLQADDPEYISVADQVGAEFLSRNEKKQ